MSARPSDRTLDLLQIARRLPHQLTIDRLDVRYRLLEHRPQGRAEPVEGGDRKRAAPLERRVQHAALVPPAHRRGDVGADDLGHAVVRDDAPPLHAIEKGDGVGDLGFGNRVDLQLRVLDQICAFARLSLVASPGIGGDSAGGNQRLPPGHALSRIFTPTTSPSRTGMIVATSRRSRAASSLNARTPSAFGEWSLGSMAAPWKNALSHRSSPPRRSSFMPQSKYLGSGSLSASMNTASKPGGSVGKTSSAEPSINRTRPWSLAMSNASRATFACFGSLSIVVSSPPGGSARASHTPL